MARQFENLSGSNPFLAGLQWSERYGCYSTKVNNWLELSFSYVSNEGYQISVAGKRLKGRAKEPKDAATLAVLGARQLLLRTLEQISGALDIPPAV
jgi:hypothetical protein